MIVADTSALVAVVFGEPDYAIYAAALDGNRVAISAATLTEALLVVTGRHGPEGTRELELVVETSIDEINSLDAQSARTAFAAWRRFGKGRHPAALNLGDCFSYAAAKEMGAPLLFKGTDFAQTDVASALD